MIARIGGFQAQIAATCRSHGPDMYLKTVTFGVFATVVQHLGWQEVKLDIRVLHARF